MKAKEKPRYLSLVFALVGTFVIAGCIVIPVRTRTIIQDPAGQKQSLPKLLIAPGTTTRQQVEQGYGAFSIDTGTPNLFWGRFRKSAWYVFAGAGGYGGAAATGGRTWGTYNLLVRFDSEGNVKASEVVHDKELVKHFIAMSNGNELATLDFSQSICVGGAQVGITSAPGTSIALQLSASNVVITRQKPNTTFKRKPKPRPPEVVTLPLSEITGIRVDGYSDQANEIPITVSFSHKTKLGKQITFRAVPSAVLTLVRWQQRRGKE